MSARRLLARVGRALRLGLLLPVLPVIWFGPITHPEINRRALRKAKELKAAGGAINAKLLRVVSENEEAFVFGGNSADAISTQHVLNGIAIYDYAHNQIPNLADGSPLFGYRLISKWLEHEGTPGAYPPRELAVACGWLAHQVADFYAHYAVVDSQGVPVKAGAANGSTFNGYANSHRVLGTSFYHEVLDEYTTLDHGLIEFFHDFAVIQGDTENYYDDARVELFEGGTRNLLTETSETFRDSRCRIPPERIGQLKDDFNLVIKGTRLLIEILRVANPNLVNTLEEAFPAGVDYLDLSADRVVEQLFLKTDEEITARGHADAAQDETIGRSQGLGGGVSAVFPIVHGIASAVGLDTDRYIKLLRTGDGSDLESRLLSPVHWLVQRSLGGVTKLINLENLAKRAHDTNAVLGFLEILLSAKKPSLAAARLEFAEHLRPVIVFPGLDPNKLAEGLAGQLRQGQVFATVVPTVPVNGAFNPAHPKALDPGSLLFQIDGYDAGSGLFDLQTETDGAGRFVLSARLKDHLRSGATHHVFIDVRDRSGAESRYVDIQVPLDGGQPLPSKSADEGGH